MTGGDRVDGFWNVVLMRDEGIRSQKEENTICKKYYQMVFLCPTCP